MYVVPEKQVELEEDIANFGSVYMARIGCLLLIGVGSG
jgi:hypothetical protein